MGIFVSGCILYVKGVLVYVNKMNVEIVVFFCNVYSDISKNLNYVLEINVGFEVLIGFMRLKLGIV